MSQSNVQKEILKPLGPSFTWYEYIISLGYNLLNCGSIIDDALQHNIIERIPGGKYKYRDQPILPRDLYRR